MSAPCGRLGRSVTVMGDTHSLTHKQSERWPRQMRAETAAAYVDEVSVAAFRRAVPLLYPQPRIIPGKGERWLIEELDAALNRIHGVTDEKPVDLAGLV